LPESLELAGDRIPLRGRRTDPWQDAFWSGHAQALPMSSRKRPVLWQEQAELWSAHQGPSAAAAPAREASRAGTNRAALAVADDEFYEVALDVRAERATRRPAKAVRTAEMARLLQVTGAVNGVVAAQRFALPHRRFFAHVSQALWKESPIGTPFVTGC
jgi:hypothetical protein